ncbi:MAG TPA: hypothetical protein VKG20_13550 [Methylomirabilota bacterium]|nr:hypothetical protein [Methylomirabilota bacterium]
MDPFGLAARAYLVYGVIYWLGGFYLATQGVGVRGDRMMQPGVAWILLGLVLVAAIPYLLARRRAWFERWILSRRDFARVLTVFMAVRAWHVLRVALRSETASVAAPWGGEVTFRAGAIVFLIVTVAALLLIGRAAWAEEAA